MRRNTTLLLSVWFDLCNYLQDNLLRTQGLPLTLALHTDPVLGLGPVAFGRDRAD